ncbi:hypothetical protein R1flu_020305 [Riccia fluitans]|uniref:rRNA-processing protein FYV7 n=1 Tax=Riccia fluitans TaxID=41844 RepID=A0ABD1ZMA6_9MARC
MKGGSKSRNPGAERASGVIKPKFKPKGKAKKKLGGGGLSLEAFVGAKSKPAVNPAQIREHREFYQNAKKVQKYKKLVKQLNEQGRGTNAEQTQQGQDEVANGGDESRGHKRSGAVRKPQFIKGNQSLQFKMQRKMEKKERGERGPSQVEKLRAGIELKRQQEEEERKEREEQFAREKEIREKALRHRKEVQDKMRKRTGRGQPVMKHRMEHLLETIQKG